MKRRFLVFIFAGLLILSAAACKSGGYYQDGGSISEVSGSKSAVQSDTDTADSEVIESVESVSAGTSSVAGSSIITGSAVSTSSSSVSSKKTDSKINLETATFNGVTLKRIRWYDMSAQEKQMIADWEKKTGAKIEDVYCGFEQIQEKITQSIKSRKPIDIGFIYGAWFPGDVIAKMYQPVDAYMDSKYLVDTANLTKGGFDITKMNEYKWKNHYYGLSSYWDVDMLALYFRPSVFKQYSQTDPNTLLQQGNWNWDTFYDAAKKITDLTNKAMYGFSRGLDAKSGHDTHWISAAGTSVVVQQNGNPIMNFSDQKLISALKFFQKITTGNTAVCSADHNFKDGKAAMFVGGLYDAVHINKTAVDAVKKDWDIAPVPLSKDNKTGKYPSDWLKAIGITVGSKNADAVASFALFSSKYKRDNQYEDIMKDKANRMEPYFKNVQHANYGYGTLVTKMGQFFGEIAKGEDITKLMNDNKSVYQSEISKTLAR